MTNPRLAFALSALLAVAVAGCGGSPKRRFYTLQAPLPHSAHGTVVDPSRPSLAVGPVSVPEVVDRAQLVVRAGDNRLDVSDVHYWAEPLQNEIASVLAAALAREFDIARVSVQGQATAGEPDIRVAVDVLRFESVPGSAATVEAAWMARRKSTEPPLRGHSVARETVSDASYEALVAAHAQALRRIGHDIAEAIRAYRP